MTTSLSRSRNARVVFIVLILLLAGCVSTPQVSTEYVVDAEPILIYTYVRITRTGFDCEKALRELVIKDANDGEWLGFGRSYRTPDPDGGCTSEFDIRLLRSADFYSLTFESWFGEGDPHYYTHDELTGMGRLIGEVALEGWPESSPEN